METEYGQDRKYFHNVRFSPEEKIIRERMGKYNYTRVSDSVCGREEAGWDGIDEMR